MFWVMNEICGEMNMMKRVKIIKRFIKIASEFVVIHLSHKRLSRYIE